MDSTKHENFILSLLFVKYNQLKENFLQKCYKRKESNTKKNRIWRTQINFYMFKLYKDILRITVDADNSTSMLIKTETKMYFYRLTSECSVLSSVSTLPSPILPLPVEILAISETALVPTTIEVVTFKIKLKKWKHTLHFCHKPK